MHKIQLVEDIQSVSEFRANTTAYNNQVKETERPLVLTQHGKSSTVLMDVVEHHKLVDRLDLIDEIRSAQSEISRGEGLEHDDALKILLGKIKK